MATKGLTARRYQRTQLQSKVNFEITANKIVVRRWTFVFGFCIWICFDGARFMRKLHSDTIKHLSEHPQPLSWCSVNFSLVEPSLDNPALFHQKRLSCEALILRSGIFWPAPDKNFVGFFSKLITRLGLNSLSAVRSKRLGSLLSSLSWFLAV
jgi:hypothetical protein